MLFELDHERTAVRKSAGDVAGDFVSDQRWRRNNLRRVPAGQDAAALPARRTRHSPRRVALSWAADRRSPSRSRGRASRSRHRFTTRVRKRLRSRASTWFHRTGRTGMFTRPENRHTSAAAGKDSDLAIRRDRSRRTRRSRVRIIRVPTRSSPTTTSTIRGIEICRSRHIRWQSAPRFRITACLLKWRR